MIWWVAASSAPAPLAVWVVDDEEALRRAWRFEPDDLVTNRPLWASALLRRWRAAELRACGAVTQPSTPTATPTP